MNPQDQLIESRHDSADRRDVPVWLRALAGAAMIAVACWLLGWFLLHDRRETDRVITWAFWIGAGAAAVCFVGVPRLLPRRAPEVLILATTALLVAGAARWNVAYDRYWRTLDYPHEIFRVGLHRPYTPVYGRPARLTAANVAVTIASAIALAGGAAFFAIASPRRRTLRWIALVAAQLVAIVCFARSEQPPRLPYDVAGYGIQTTDVAQFTSVRDLLANYTARMPSLTWSSRHYPPGNVLVWFVQSRLGWIGIFKAIVVAAVLATMLPLLWLCRELRLDEQTARLAVALYGCSAAVVVHTTINKTPLVVLFAVIAVWGVVRSLNTGRRVPAAVAGAAMLVYWLFSFSVAIVGGMILIVVALAVLVRRVTWRRAATTLGVFAIVLAAGWLALRVGTGLDLLACMRVAVAQHALQQQNNPYWPLKAYVIRSTGNLLAYALDAPATLIALSIPAAVMLLRTRHRPVPQSEAPQDQSLLGPMLLATWLTILGAGFSGLFWLETERIWTFLTPLLAVPAAVGLRSIVMSRSGDDRLDRAAVVSIVTAIVAGVALLATYEMLLLPYVP